MTTNTFTMSFRTSVRRAVGDPGAQADIWLRPEDHDDIFVIRLSDGAMIKASSYSGAINQARDFWRAHQRLTGDSNEGARVGSAQ